MNYLVEVKDKNGEWKFFSKHKNLSLASQAAELINFNDEFIVRINDKLNNKIIDLPKLPKIIQRF